MSRQRSAGLRERADHSLTVPSRPPNASACIRPPEPRPRRPGRVGTRFPCPASARPTVGKQPTGRSPSLGGAREAADRTRRHVPVPGDRRRSSATCRASRSSREPDDPDYEPLTAWRAQLERRLHLLEPLRRRLREVPFGLDHPYWIEDPDFDLDFHVRQHRGAAAGRRPPDRRPGGPHRGAPARSAAARCGRATSSRAWRRRRRLRRADQGPPRHRRRRVGGRAAHAHARRRSGGRRAAAAGRRLEARPGAVRRRDDPARARPGSIRKPGRAVLLERRAPPARSAGPRATRCMVAAANQVRGRPARPARRRPQRRPRPRRGARRPSARCPTLSPPPHAVQRAHHAAPPLRLPVGAAVDGEGRQERARAPRSTTS